MKHVVSEPPPPPLDGGADLIAWADGLRATSNVWYSEALELYHVFGYDLATRIFSETDLFSSDLSAVMPNELFMQGNFMRMDPPEHRRYRNLINKAFTARSVQQLVPSIQSFCDEIIGALPTGENIDIVEKFCFPLPLSVIAQLLGTPVSDREMFAQWADDLFSGNIRKPFDKDAIDEVEAAAKPMHDYLLAHVRSARTEGGQSHPGLIEDVARVELDGETLTDEEAVTFGALALVAGHITTTSLLGSSLLCLQRNRDALAALTADLDLVPAFVDEVLRTRPPFLALPRYVTEDTELDGHKIAKGSVVVPSIYAANRDPERFPDPHRFDMTRGDYGVTFGHGVHFCLGSQLARLEADIALRALLARTPSIEVLDDPEPTFFGAQGLMGCKSLNVVLGTSPGGPT